jgi:hypothetical protein
VQNAAAQRPLSVAVQSVDFPRPFFSFSTADIIDLQVTKAFVAYIVGDLVWLLLEPRAVPSRCVLLLFAPGHRCFACRCSSLKHILLFVGARLRIHLCSAHLHVLHPSLVAV